MLQRIAIRYESFKKGKLHGSVEVALSETGESPKEIGGFTFIYNGTFYVTSHLPMFIEEALAEKVRFAVEVYYMGMTGKSQYYLWEEIPQ